MVAFVAAAFNCATASPSCYFYLPTGSLVMCVSRQSTVTCLSLNRIIIMGSIHPCAKHNWLLSLFILSQQTNKQYQPSFTGANRDCRALVAISRSPCCSKSNRTRDPSKMLHIPKFSSPNVGIRGLCCQASAATCEKVSPGFVDLLYVPCQSVIVARPSFFHPQRST